GAGKGVHLIEQTQGVAHASVGLAGDGLQRLPFRRDALPAADEFKPLADARLGNALEIESLHARKDGVGQLVRLRGREYEDHVGRRLFQSLEQRVEGRLGKHVHFVDHVDFVAAVHGRVVHLLAQLADIVHAVVGGAVDLEHVHGTARIHRLAVLASVAGDGGGPLLAVQGLGQYAGRGGLAYAAGAREKVGVGYAPALYGVAYGLGDVVLAHHILESARA